MASCAAPWGDKALDEAALAHGGPGCCGPGQSKAVAVKDSAGQDAEIFFDTYPAPPTLFIFGGVHVGIPLMKYAKILGFRVNVIDPRGIFATKERFAEADELAIEHPDDYLDRVQLHENSYVVVLTHDPKHDEPILKRVVETNVSYIGAIGSRKTNAERVERLMAQGVSREKLAQVHSPIGLDIGSQVPEEIALAIMAEVVAARYGKAADRCGTPKGPSRRLKSSSTQLAPTFEDRIPAPGGGDSFTPDWRAEMLFINNDDVQKVLHIEDALRVLEDGHLELARQELVARPRVNIYTETNSAERFHRWGTMEGSSKGLHRHAIRMKSDIISWRDLGDGKRVEDKYCYEPGLYCGLIFLFDTNNGEPLAIINDGILQHMRVGGWLVSA